MGTVTGTTKDDSDDSDEEEGDNTRYNVTWDDYGDGNQDDENWSSHEVRNGIDLYETSIALWEPNLSNYLNERVALEVWNIDGMNHQEIVFGKVSGTSENLWTIQCDQENRQHHPLNNEQVKDGIQRFQDLKDFSEKEYKNIQMVGRNP